MIKISILYGKSDQLDNLMKLILHDFWPSNLLGAETERKIAETARRILIPIIMQITFGTSYCICCIFLPFLKIQSLLLHQAWYPNGLDERPIQMTAQIIKSYTMNFVDCFTISSYDLFYVAICINCSAQFRLVCGVIENLCSKKDRAIIWKIKDKPTFGNEEEVATELLVICLKHHQKLLE